MNTNYPAISHAEMDSATPRRGRFRWLRWPMRLLGGLAVIFAMILVVVLLIAQTRWGSDRVRVFAEEEVSNLLINARLEIGSLSGSFIFGVSGHDIRLYAADSLVASIDEVEIEYNVFGFLAGGFDFGIVRLARPRIVARQQRDSTWDLLSVIPQADPEAKPGQPIEWSIDALIISDGSAEARFRTRKDSPVTLAELNVAASGLKFGEELNAERISIRVRGWAAELPAPITVNIDASVGAESFSCDRCTLASARSRISVDGSFDFGLESEGAGADFYITIDSLSLADLKPFIPALDETRVVTGRAALQGPVDSIVASIHLEIGAGRLDMEGALTRRDTVVVILDVTLEALDPSDYWIGSPLSGTLSAELSADFRGRSFETLTGRSTLKIHDSTLNGQTLKNSNILIDVRDGLADVVGLVKLPALHLEFDGRFTPFADTVEWKLTGAASSDEFETVYPGAEGLESFALRYRTEGSSASRADYFRNFDVDIDRLVYAGFALDSTVVSANLLDQGVRITGSGRVKSSTTGGLVGSFDLDGDVVLSDGIRIEVSRLEFYSLDVGFGSDTAEPVSDLTGLIVARIDIPKTGVFTGRAAGRASGLFLSLPVDTLELDGRFDGTSLAFDAVLKTSGSELDFGGTVNLLEEGFPVAAEGTYRDLDLSAYAADSMMRSNLNGAFRVESLWNSLSDHRIWFETEVKPSTWNRQIVQSGRIEVNSDNGSATLRASIKTPEGGIEFAGGALVTDSTTTLTALDGSFTELRIGNILGIDGLSTNLSGGFDLENHGDTLYGAIDLEPSAINRSTLKRGKIAVTLSMDSVKLDGLVEFDVGKIRVVGDGRRGIRGTEVQAMFQMDSLDVAALAGLHQVGSSVNIGCTVLGTISGAADSELSGLCLATNSRIGNVVVDSARIEATVKSQTISVDQILVRSNVVDIDGSGIAYLGQPNPSDPENAMSDLRIAVVVKELDYLEQMLNLDLLEGEGIVDLSVTGKPGAPNILVEPHLAFLTYGDIRVSSIDGYLQISDLEPLAGEAVLDVGFSVFGGFPVRRTSLSLLVDPETVIFVADMTQSKSRRASLAATYTRSTENPELRIEDLTLNLAGTVWKLSQEAVVEMGEFWNVKQFLIYHDNGQIALDGYIDLDGEQNLIFTAEEVEMSAFIDLFGIEDVRGALEGYVVLGGPADSLVAEAYFRVRNLSTLGETVGDVRLRMDLADGRLNLAGHVGHVSGHGIDITGSVPMNLTLRGDQTVYEADPLDLVVAADSLPLDWMLPLLDRSLISGIAGLLDADLRISGSWEDLVLEGSGTVTRGLAVLPDFNTALADVDADFSLSGNVLTINHLRATTGTGWISGTGRIDFETPENLGLGLDLQFEDFRAIETETYQFTVSGTAQVSGSMRAPVVTADVSIGPGDVFLTEELLADEVESIGLTPRDLRTLERRFGYRIASSDTSSSDFMEALALDARVDIGHGVWLRSSSNPAMDIQFGGDLTVKKDPFSEQRIIGTINVDPSRSRIIQFAKRFGVDRGTITFNGLLEDAVIDFRAEYVVPSRFGGDEVRILLAVTGLMDELVLDITSEPQMDDATIVSYLLTGRPPGEATVSGEQAAEIAIGGVSRLVEAFANENFGLDIVEIEVSGAQGTRLTVGKYISPRTYIFVKQPLTADVSTNNNNGSRSTEIGLEYEIFSWLIGEVSSRRGYFRGNLRWQVSY